MASKEIVSCDQAIKVNQSKPPDIDPVILSSLVPCFFAMMKRYVLDHPNKTKKAHNRK